VISVTRMLCMWTLTLTIAFMPIRIMTKLVTVVDRIVHVRFVIWIHVHSVNRLDQHETQGKPERHVPQAVLPRKEATSWRHTHSPYC